MEKHELKRSIAIQLYADMKSYVEEVGKKDNPLAWMCNNLMTYDPNEAIAEEYEKGMAKLKKDLDRKIGKATNSKALLYLDGDKKGSFILGEKPDQLLFTAESRNLLNEEIYKFNDEYEASAEAFLKEKVDFYIDQASAVPEKLSVKYRNSLYLLIPETDTKKSPKLAPTKPEIL